MRGLFLRLGRYSGKIIFQGKTINRYYSKEPQNKLRNILKLHERGMFEELFPSISINDVSSLLNHSPQCVYAGFDPTADSLHIGNLLILMNLLHWQRGGHNVIAVVGGATGLIGDPSHRKNEREFLHESILNQNIVGIKENIQRIFNNHAKHFWQNKEFPLPPIKIINNIEWYKDVNVLDFIRNTGQHFRMGTMLGKTSVESRLKSETGMSFTEFTYQIFQAYDWLHLLKTYNCKFQIGGNDQLGNITSGHELISRTEKKKVFGFTLPLITAEGGRKFGKSTGNAVWLSPKKSSSFQLYQYFIRTADADVEKFLKFFTFLPVSQIQHIVNEHKKHPEERKAQQILADNITLLVHGEEELLAAKNASLLLYDRSLEALTTMTQEQIITAFEGSNVVHLISDPNMTVFDLAMKAKCFKTENDALRIIAAGGFYINYEKITDINKPIQPNVHILPNNVTLLRTGKKTYHIVQWIELHRAENVK